MGRSLFRNLLFDDSDEDEIMRRVFKGSTSSRKRCRYIEHDRLVVSMGHSLLCNLLFDDSDEDEIMKRVFKGSTSPRKRRRYIKHDRLVGHKRLHLEHGLHLYTGMAQRGHNDMNLKGSRSKKKKMVDNSNWRPWSELPVGLLDQITKSLGAIDHLMFGCVCRRWRLYAVAHRQEFMISQPPLVVFLSDCAQRACYFYDIFDQRLYKATLPNLVGKSISGLTCGYMIMKDKKERKDSPIWLLNPFTRHELRFPCPPKPYSAIILASLGTPSQEFIIVAINQFIQFCRSTDVSWTVHDLNDTFFSSSTDCSGQRWFEDGIVFKGKIYVLTNLGEIGVLNLNSHPYVTLLEVKRIGDWSSRIKLLAFDDKLLMIHRFNSFLWKFEVYELNFAKMKWVKMQNLKDEALFLSLRTSGYSNVTKWRGSQQPMNCIYNLLVGKYEYTLQFLDGNFSNFPKSFPLMKEECDTYFALELEVPRCRISLPGTNFNTLSWYFPNLSCNVDALSDNYLTS